MLLFIGILLAVVFIVIPSMLAIQMWYDRTTLRSWRKKLTKGDRVTDQQQDEIRTLSVVSIHEGKAMLRNAKGQIQSALVEDLYPCHYFQEQGI